MKVNNRAKNSGIIVMAAMVGAFASRYFDIILEKFPFPLDILGIVIASLFLFFVIYLIWGKWLD
jgi:hypothetical protein